MTRKNALCIFFVLPLIVSVVLINGSVQGAVTLISLNPVETIVPPEGESLPYNFTVDVNITSVSNLWVFEFQLDYDTNILDAISVTPGPVVPATRILAPIDDNGTWIPINDTLGRVSVTCSFLTPETPYTGSGTLMRINFTATAGGISALQFTSTSLYGPLGSPILHEKLDGSVTVIPEFPAILVLPLLLIATLAAAFLGKIVRSRKRQGPTIA